LPDAREIAGELIARLPKHDGDRAASPVRHRHPRRWPTIPRLSPFWMCCLVLGAAALFSLIRHGFPFGTGFP
jgi:hypothetical protein